MEDILVFPAGSGDACKYAAISLRQRGIPLVYHPTPEVTHLLLDVPTKDVPVDLLDMLPENLCVVGGSLSHPALQKHRKLDLLSCEQYLAQNAAITADCALQVAALNSRQILWGSSVLVIGWGRIGKCLSDLLRRIGCRVTVAARKASDRSILAALGYEAVDFDDLCQLHSVGIVFNTVPAQIPGVSRFPDALKIDLASQRGLEGDDVIWARGLPSLYAPVSSGKLIADTFIKEVTP